MSCRPAGSLTALRPACTDRWRKDRPQLRQTYVYVRTLQSCDGGLKAPHATIAGAATSVTGPMVSCLMVTRGDIARTRLSIDQFKQQTYKSRELVIVCDHVEEDLKTLIRQSGDDVRLVMVGPGLALGELRNVSVEEARGDLVCQWDDDDLYSADRIEHGVGAMLEAGADALFLRQWFIWWPAKMVLSVSMSRIWEGSMIAFKRAVGPYPALARDEDTMMVDALLRRSSIAVLDDPLSYCYCIHGQNTWSDGHMQRLVDGSRLRFEYGAALAAFSSTFDFESHPAFSEPDRATASTHSASSRSQARRLARYLAFNQLMRRVKRT